MICFCEYFRSVQSISETSAAATMQELCTMQERCFMQQLFWPSMRRERERESVRILKHVTWKLQKLKFHSFPQSKTLLGAGGGGEIGVLGHSLIFLSCLSSIGQTEKNKQGESCTCGTPKVAAWKACFKSSSYFDFSKKKRKKESASPSRSAQTQLGAMDHLGVITSSLLLCLTCCCHRRFLQQ